MLREIKTPCYPVIYTCLFLYDSVMDATSLLLNVMQMGFKRKHLQTESFTIIFLSMLLIESSSRIC